MKNWYLLKTQNNYERVIAERLTSECKASNIDVKCVVPMERTIVMKNGKKELKESVYMMGYVYVYTDSVGEVYNISRFIQGTQGFLKDKKSNKASQLTERDTRQLYKLIGEDFESNQNSTMIIEPLYKVGDLVIINNGAYDGIKGVVGLVDNNMVNVTIKIFNKDLNIEVEQSDLKLQ